MKKIRASACLLMTLAILFICRATVFSQTQKVDFSDVKAAAFQSDKTTELLDLDTAASDITFAGKSQKISYKPSNANKPMSNSDLSTISRDTERDSSRQFVKSLDPHNNSLLDYKHLSRFDSGSSENSINVVPAPGSIILTAIGISIIGWFRRRNALK